MITDSLNLHRNSEAALTLVDASAVINENEINTKIKITYDEALQEIFGLANEVEYKKYFYKILNEQEAEDSPRVLGAAVDKTLGDIFVVVKNQSNNDASVFKKTLNGNWQKNFCLNLNHMGTYLNRENNLAQKKFKKGNLFFILADKNTKLEPEDAASYFGVEKGFCPINQPQITEIFINTLGYNFAPNCYTINYQDIANKFQYNKMKSARN